MSEKQDNSFLQKIFDKEQWAEAVDFGKEIAIIADSTQDLSSKLTSLKKIISSFRSPVGAAVSVLSILGGTIYEAFQCTKECAQLGELAEQSGVATEKFQTLANASKKYGGSVDSTAKSLSTLGANLRDVQKGGDGNGLKDFLSNSNVNIDGLKSVEQLMPIIAREMDGLASDAEKFDMGKALGLDNATIKLLSGGIGSLNSELSSAQKYNVFSDKDIECSKEIDENLQSITTGIESIINGITKTLMPILSPLVSMFKSLIDFFVANSAVISGMFYEILAVLVTVLSFLGGSFLASIGIVATAIAGILVVLFLINKCVYNFIKWLRGAHPIIKKLIDSLIRFKDLLVQLLIKIWDITLNLLAKAWNGIKILCRKIVSIFVGIATKVFTVFSSMFSKLGKFLRAFLKHFPDWLVAFLKNGGSIGLLVKGIGAINERRKESAKNGSHANGLGYVPFDGYMAELHKGESVLTSSETNALSGLMLGKRAIAETSDVPIASMSLGSINGAYSNNNSTRNFTIGDITIQTAATDADGIASELMQSIKMAFNGLDTGVQA